MLMKLAVIRAIVLMAHFAFMQAAVSDDTTIEQRVLEFQSARFKAMVDEDVELLGRFLTDDLTYAHTTGITETKTEFLSTIASGRIDYIAIVPSEVVVRVYGDVAVLTGLARLRGAVGDREVDFTLRFLDVSRRVGDNWQLAAWQSVRVPEASD